MPLYLLGVPLSRALELTGQWPRITRGGGRLGNFGDYKARAGDVFACAWFKSGTTWLLQMTLQIAFRGEADFDDIHEVVPWPDSPPQLKRYIVPLDEDSPRKRSPTGLRVIKTHLALDSVPYSPDARYIALVRDPKDACVSAYRFLGSMALGPLAPSVKTWVDCFLDKDFNVASWAGHLNSYWQVRARPNVLFLTYEEMKRDAHGAVRKIADFMGVDLTATELEKVVKRSSFAYMKEHESRFNPGHVVPWGAAGGYMMRRGERGSSGELLSPELERRIDDVCRARLVELGCDFPYDEAFAR
ncbi:MAG TPA: sulfotransferase domain-containing protein [Gammaproteobacteria bacterium]|nr:sulfotransferase domain-containing protein [Gammaproteobacteria bacterium]